MMAKKGRGALGIEIELEKTFMCYCIEHSIETIMHD